MSDRNRRDRGALVALAVALLAIVLVVWIGQPTQDTTAAPKSGNVEKPDQHDIDRLISAIREFDPWDDTYAQWLMALFGVAATVISYRAVTIVRDTLVESRKATQAAQDAIAVTREIGEAQLRAYLVPEECVLEYADTWWPTATITFRNSGQSPADNIAVAAGLSLNKKHVSAYITSRRSELIPKATLGFDGVATHEVALDKSKTIEGLELYVIVGGSVAYTDSFNRRWCRNFVFYAPPGHKTQPKAGKMIPGHKYLPEHFVGYDKEPGQAKPDSY